MLTWLVGGVALLNVYALVLVVARGVLYRTPVYRPMLLNLGLSIVPVFVLGAVVLALASLLAAQAPVAVTATVTAVGTLVWLVLLPNAGYLVTELNFSHRRADDPVPLWFDIVAVLTLALSGVMNTVVNVLVAQMFYAVLRYPDDDAPFERPSSWIAVAVVLVLVTVGIYLGRYVRFNSWDLLHPASFVRKLGRHLRTPGVPAQAVLFCVLHSVLLGLVYAIVVGPLTTLFVRGGA
ncbi:DUF1361 domain-containing protein [Cellulosimicrobium cellulans]|uniref:DUF1361 domain-containing protein n=1 Tax=Cellulosimicrobium cellulans TaxID=1710 RepID=UPI000848B0BE|nr:DUF1361 domain-containing protein [Cellulosimicrobium cellulans]